MFCSKCGFQNNQGEMFCKQCGKPIDDGQELCEDCAKNANAQQATQNTTSNSSTVTPESKSKLAAGLLGIFLGGWGIHNFYLGFTGKGIAQIIVTIVTCGIGSLWGFVEGILILTGSINTDAQGIPLKD